jgi:uncharacterized DUF497 family protein
MNFDKHGIHFSDLEPVFEDEKAIVMDEFVRGEERSIIMGMDGLAAYWSWYIRYVGMKLG